MFEFLFYCVFQFPNKCQFARIKHIIVTERINQGLETIETNVLIISKCVQLKKTYLAYLNVI